jgi:hypothetical protein
VDRAVAVEWIGIAPERREFGLGAVAQIDAAQVVGNAPHDLEVHHTELVVDGRQDAAEGGMAGRIDRLEGTFHAAASSD